MYLSITKSEFIVFKNLGKIFQRFFRNFSLFHYI